MIGYGKKLQVSSIKILILAGIGATCLMLLSIIILDKENKNRHNRDRLYNETKDETPSVDDFLQTSISNLQDQTVMPTQDRRLPLRQSSADISNEKRPIDNHTLKFFQKLLTMFNDSTDIDEYMENVTNYLSTQFSDETAQALFEIFKKKFQCNMELETKLDEWGVPGSYEENLGLLAKVHEFRQAYLGKDIADALYGKEVKNNEYHIRREQIIRDKIMSGPEKEEQIQALNREMWEDSADTLENNLNPYQRYQEKLLIYKTDLARMSQEEEKTELIRQIREACFDSEGVNVLERIDRERAAEKESKELYQRRKLEVVNRSDLTGEEKSVEIEAIQEEVFGDDVTAFRRREMINADLEKHRDKWDIRKTDINTIGL